MFCPARVPKLHFSPLAGKARWILALAELLASCVQLQTFAEDFSAA
jgi:hypothetical protein